MEGIQRVEYNGILVLTTQQIAEAYGTDYKVISKNFKNNEDRYIEGKHFICLTGEELKQAKANRKFYDLQMNANKFYLWTQKGAFLHAKSLNTDTAWEVYDRLVDSYFEKQDLIIDLEQLDPQTRLMNLLVQSISRQELEQKRLSEQQKKLEEKVNKQTEAIQTVKDTFVKGETEEDSLQWVKHCINRIAESPNFTYTFGNKYAAAKNESYQRLTAKVGCRLDQKVRNAIDRARERGYARTQIDSINKFTVIMADKKLKEIYIGVVKEMMIAYCVEV